MLLAVDIGNTNIVFALYRKSCDLVSLWRLETNEYRTRDEYASFLLPLFERGGYSFKDISFVLVGSVVPEADRHITRFCADYIGCEAQFVTYGNAGVRVDLPRPEQVGADRLINAVAVTSEYKLPAVVVDFGTATTFDVLDGDGTYLGGAISPGIRLSIDALAQATAKLPKVKVVSADKVIGKNTDEAIQAGVFWGYVGLIEGILKQINKELDVPIATVIATGGLAPLFAEHIDVIQGVDETLTLKGLLAIYKDMKQL